MAKLITRTFISTEATLMGVVIKDMKPEVAMETVIINAQFDNIKAAQKWVDKNYKGEIAHPCVAAIKNVEELRGITPEAFYSNSIMLDPVTRKPINTTEDFEVEEA